MTIDEVKGPVGKLYYTLGIEPKTRPDVFRVVDGMDGKVDGRFEIGNAYKYFETHTAGFNAYNVNKTEEALKDLLEQLGSGKLYVFESEHTPSERLLAVDAFIDRRSAQIKKGVQIYDPVSDKIFKDQRHPDGIDPRQALKWLKEFSKKYMPKYLTGVSEKDEEHAGRGEGKNRGKNAFYIDDVEIKKIYKVLYLTGRFTSEEFKAHYGDRPFLRERVRCFQLEYGIPKGEKGNKIGDETLNRLKAEIVVLSTAADEREKAGKHKH